MAIDIYIFHLLNDLAGLSLVFDKIIIFFADYIQYPLIALFIFMLAVSARPKKEKLNLFLIAFIAAALSRLGITPIIRLIFQRPRPFVDLQIHNLMINNSYSFPSGHAAFFFAFSTAIYLYNKKWGAGFFIASVLITLSRVIAGIHYPSDIFAGTIIGITVGYIIFKIFNILAKRRAISE